MTFLWADLLWLLLLAPALVAAYILAQRKRQKYALRYSSLSLVREALGRGPGVRRHIPAALFFVGLTALLLALGRPAASIMSPARQGTVVLTFDVSGSMRAEDLQPNRLEAAKTAARLFIEKQPKNVRVGVVSFSDSASIVQIPTTDREAVLASVNRLAFQRRTAIGSGILTSLDAIFEDAAARPAPTTRDPLGAPQTTTTTPAPVAPGSYRSAVIILLSDGQSNTGPRPQDVVGQAADRGVRIYTVGIGSAEGTIVSAGGASVRVRLDEETLKDIAQKTDGTYSRAESETDLSSIYENLSTRLVLKAERTEITALFAALAAVLLLVAGVLSLMWFSRLP